MLITTRDHADGRKVTKNVNWQRINCFQLIFPGEGALCPLPDPTPKFLKIHKSLSEQDMQMCLLLRKSTPNYFTGHVCKQTISEITLVVIENLDGIGNNVMVSPGYVIATTLKPRYLMTVHKSSL